MPAHGPAGVYTFVLDVESGARVTYEWATNVIKAGSGQEPQRISLRAAPREIYDFAATLDDDTLRLILAALLENAADAPVFRVALPYEALPLVADPSGAFVTVPDMDADWLVNGQRVAILSADDEVFETFIEDAAAGPGLIELGAAPGDIGRAGGTIMPTVAVHLASQTGVASFQVNAHTLQIRARKIDPGYAGDIEMGVGATVDTFDGLPVFDRGISIESTLTSSVESFAETIDLGGKIEAVAKAAVPDLGRQLRFARGEADDFQWFKRFLSTVLGRQKAFLLPTERPDLVYVTHAGVNLTVTDSAQYVEAWFPSLAHRRLALVKTDGTVQYVTVESAGDNGNGTQTLELGAAITGTVETISFLEQCRLEKDDVTIAWQTFEFTSETRARVIQSASTDDGANWFENEMSVQGSAPIELYTFITPEATYRITSYPVDVDHGGFTFAATPGARSSTAVSAGADRNGEFSVELPATHALPQAYVNGIPPREITCTILRKQSVSGAAVVIGFGYATGLGFKGRLASFRVPVTEDSLETPIPTKSVSRLCQHMLYDDRCTVDRDGSSLGGIPFKVETTIATIATDRLSLTVVSVGTWPDDWGNRGELVHPTSTERRYIKSQIGTAIVLNYRLPPNVFVSDAVELFAGCDKTIATCGNLKFDNQENFGGTPQIPTKNPHYFEPGYVG